MNELLNRELAEFLSESPTAFHAVSNIRTVLENEGYTELCEADEWHLAENGKYFTVRNGSSVIAFRYPGKNYTGFMIGASHSDSPAFKLKPNPETDSAGVTRLNVEGYGGMLCAPWFDRPLSVAGRLMVDCGDHMDTKLVKIDEDLCMIPNLAIHMNRDANKGHAYNIQKELLPVIKLAGEGKDWMTYLSEKTGIAKEKILASDLFLYPRTAPSVWGMNHEFLSAPHLDDLQCAFGNLKGFLAASPADSCAVYAVFDNEEVGSGTKQGADSEFLNDILERIAESSGKSSSRHKADLANSFMVSADNAHAVHPNYADLSDPTNHPAINKGIVIKHNANQKYTTDAVSAAFFKKICEIAKVPFQEFVNRSDLAGGSTLGNISTAHVSVNCVDIGLPQWAMHSPYETAGTEDTESLVKAMKVFFSSSMKDLGNGNYRIHTDCDKMK